MKYKKHKRKTETKVYKERIAKIRMEGNQTLSTEVVEPGTSQKTILRLPGVPAVHQNRGIPATTDHPNYKLFHNNSNWAESVDSGFGAERSYLKQKNKNLDKMDDGISMFSPQFSSKGNHSFQEDVYYEEKASFTSNVSLSSQFSSIYSFSDDAQQLCDSSNTCSTADNAESAAVIDPERTAFTNQNYQFNSYIEAPSISGSYREADNRSEVHAKHYIKSRGAGLTDEQKAQESNDLYKINSKNLVPGHDPVRWNGILKSPNNVDSRAMKYSEGDSNDSDFVGSDDGQKDLYTTYDPQDNSTATFKQLDGYTVDTTVKSTRDELTSDCPEKILIQSPVNEKEAVFHKKNEGTELVDGSAALITDLLKCDISLDITNLYKIEELLNAKDGVTSLLCTLGDEIVNKLVAWTKQLPFYKEIPVEVHSSLLTKKWHELLLLMTSAYNSLQRPEYKQMSREDLSNRNMGRLKVHIFQRFLTLSSIITSFDVFEISVFENSMENAPFSIIFSKVFKT